jgi:hypothetical protein
MLIYAVPAHISELPTMVPLDLIPGNKVVLSVDRVFDDVLDLELVFRRQPPWQKRPELGDWHTDRDSYVSLGDAADVQIQARINDGPSTTLEAWPPNAYNGDNIWRGMGSPAVDRKWHVGPPYPPAPVNDIKGKTLHRGRNSVLLEVTVVEPPLVGERVEVAVDPPLFWYRGGRGWTAIFNYSFFIVPFFIIIQVIWAFILILNGGTAFYRYHFKKALT